MRQIVLDTETTGLDPQNGDRLVEIAAVELLDGVPSGQDHQWYLNPERDISQEAQSIHGLTREFLKDKPLFSQIADDFLSFIDHAPLIIHNAAFDLKFLNAELVACGYPELGDHPIVDTLLVARNKFPGAPASLDALCKRFGIDHQHRQKHSALVDCHLLAQVYCELTGGRQTRLSLTDTDSSAAQPQSSDEPQSSIFPGSQTPQQKRPSTKKRRPHGASSEEKTAHTQMLQRIHDPLWLHDE